MVYTDGTALVADTIEELHAFAQKTGVFTFADHRRRPHYIMTQYELPTVLAHGAKRTKTSAVIKISNAMAKKRDEWWKEATDDQIREKIRTYAPWKRGEMIYYEGQEFTQEEMFEIWFNMFKDMKEGKNVSAYKLPKHLPLNPRQDPPTDREILSDLHNKIEHGKDLLKAEYDKPERDEERIKMITERMEELQEEYDPLELRIQEEAISDLQKKIDATGANTAASEEEARANSTALSNMKIQLQALNERLVEIKTAQAPRIAARKEREMAALTEALSKYHALKSMLPLIEDGFEEEELKNPETAALFQDLETLKADYKTLLEKYLSKHGELQDYEWFKGNSIIMDFPELFSAQDMTPVLSQNELDQMTEDIRREVTKAAVEWSLDRFLNTYPQYTKEDYFRFSASVTGSQPA